MSQKLENLIRVRAFEWMKEQTLIHGDVLPRSILENGFEIKNYRIPLVSPQGIFKPKIFNIPLSITTVPKGPYDDSFGKDGFLRYRYRGTNPDHRDNVGLRIAMNQQIPLIYFHGIIPGKYLAVWPVYIIADDPQSLTFKVAVDEITSIDNYSFKQREKSMFVNDFSDGKRAYLTTTVRRRLHQRSFREKVLHAYREQCALCRLKHLELLDAAHIIPDSDPESLPLIKNGIALCKLHHAAFDSLIWGINPDYIIEVRQDILEEEDGPMLQHGLKGLHKTKIELPNNRDFWPDSELLEKRFNQFRIAS